VSSFASSSIHLTPFRSLHAVSTQSGEDHASFGYLNEQPTLPGNNDPTPRLGARPSPV
jgi:hypothetical protein